MSTQQMIDRKTASNEAALLRAVSGRGLDAQRRRMALAVEILKGGK